MTDSWSATVTSVRLPQIAEVTEISKPVDDAIVGPQSIVLDAEALSALASGERRMQPWAEVARRTDSIFYASAATLVGITDGSSRDARIRQVAKLVRLVDVDDAIGYRAGALRAGPARRRRKPRDITVDAIVAATASGLAAPAVVVTSDPGDLALLLTDTDVPVLTWPGARRFSTRGSPGCGVAGGGRVDHLAGADGPLWATTPSSVEAAHEIEATPPLARCYCS